MAASNTIQQLIQLAQSFQNSITTGQPVNLNQVFASSSQQKTFNMNIADIEALANARLAKNGLALKSYHEDPDWDFKCVKGEDIPNFTKRFCYFREGFAGECLCGLSMQSGKPALICADINDIDSDFMSEGNLQASSTYIKHPLAFHLFRFGDLMHFDQGLCFGVPVEVLTTEDEINAWFDKFDTIYPRLQAQNTMVAEVYKNVKELGKPYKDIMKTYQKRTNEYKEARKNYEEMILNQIKRITAVDQINNDF
jgi:hypothetical protein